MSETYCAAPWRSLHIAIDGEIKVCCAGSTGYFGNLNEHHIEHALTGPRMQELRQSLRQGRLHPEYCRGCIGNERYGRSERHWHNDRNPDFDPACATQHDHELTMIDARWNYTCNLSCNYCNANFSSKWAMLENRYLFVDTARKNIDTVIDYIRPRAQNLREVALVGGEPLLMPENLRLLDAVPDDCVITVITNFSMDLEHNRVFQRLSQRPKVGWSISLENTGQRFEYVRHGASWDLMQKNIDRFQQLRKQGHWGGAHALYNIYTATRLQEFRSWLRQQEIDVVWQNLEDPSCLDPMRHDHALRSLCQEQIRDVLADPISNLERDFFEHVQNNFQAPVDFDAARNLHRHIYQIEHVYHKDRAGWFQRLWPEIYGLIQHGQTT